jgi:DNA-binding beta-propeller fold protein YncE
MTPVSALKVTGRPSERRSLLRLFGGSLAARATILCALLACALQGALCAGVAAAAEAPPLVPNGYFGAENASGIAVDQSSGNVFVSGFFGYEEEAKLFKLPQPIKEFSASGQELQPPSPFGPETYRYGVAVDPTNGRLYAAGSFAGSIEVYESSTGGLLSSFTVPPFFTGSEGFTGLVENDVQIATNPAGGDVYVPNVPEGKVFEYNEKGELQHEFAGAGTHALKRPMGVAVAPSGDVWVADRGDNRVEEFSASGAFVREFESEGVSALALDGHGHVLAIVDNGADNCEALKPPCQHLVVYSESGVKLADLGAGTFGAPGEPELHESMVAVDQASGRVYVTDGMKERVWIFQPPVVPVLGRESAVEVGTSEAKLGAVVDPGGAQATYRFEYDTREYREGEGPHGVSVPFPEGSAGEGFSSRTVWASAKGLAPDTTYDYRVVATNAVGTVVGPNQTFTTESAAQASCPNEQERGGFSAVLPDCRAYELVTPPSKTSAQPDHVHEFSPFPAGGFGGNYAADDGERFAYVSNEVMAGSQSAGLQFVATRGADGWSTEDEIPLQPYDGDRCTIKLGSFVLASSVDLSTAVVEVGNIHVGEEVFFDECDTEVVEVVPGEPLGQDNLLLRDNEDGAYQLINVTPRGVTPTTPTLIATSADLSVVVFSERAKLTPEALNNALNLYEWREGVVHLLQLELPSGTPVEGSVAGVSRDGSEVFFTAGGSLYARLNHGERTVQLDAAQGGSGPGGGGKFGAVDADGSQVLFTDEAAAGLTSDTAAGSGANLYRYDVGTGRLSDLTPVAEADASLVGMSEDGSYAYFTSKGVLTGSQANQFGETAQGGQTNLYVDHEGTITFVIHGAGGVISANGAFLAFDARTKLTAYENNYLEEIYLYSATANGFECASCNPSGQAPTGGVGLAPGWSRGVPHAVSNNGQVFFETAETLLPRDTSGVQEVYEFDWSGGLHLISTGTSATETYLLDVSASGDDVFFLTRQELVPQDSFQEANKIYDARVDGGFPETTPPPECTTADACREAPAPQPSIYGAPSSQTFSGAGNLAPPSPAVVKPKPKAAKCKKGEVKNSKGKCVRKKHKKSKKAKRASNKGRA